MIPAIAALPSPEQWRRANEILQAEIQERHEAETEVRLLNAELERRVEERTGELRENNNRLQELTTAWDLSNGFIRQFDGTISFWSEGSVHLYGWTKDQAVGRKSHDLLKTTFPKPLAEIEAELLQNGSWQGEVCDRTVNGDKRYVASRWVLRRNETGRPVSVAEVNTDISDRIRVAEADAHLAAIVESSNDAIIGQSLNGIITSWNKSAQLLYGYTAQEIVGRPFSTLLPPDKTQAHAERLARIRTPGHIERFEALRISKDGREITVMVTASPICNAEGEVVGLSTISHDVTEEKAILEKLRLSEERQRLAVEAGNIGLWFWDVDSGRTLWNDRCKQLFGLPPDAPAPALDEMFRFIHPEDVPQLTRAIDEAVSGNKDFNLEYRIIAAGGLLKWVQSSGRIGTTVDPSGRQVRRLHGVAIDFTRRKRTEEELRRTNRDLEQFAYAAAHDLQEPLRNIAISLQFAKASGMTCWAPEAKEMLEAAVTNASRMGAMIKALLSFSRALDAEGEVTPAVEANDVLQLAMQNLNTFVAETAARISCDPLPRVAMRQFHLLQIFQNLLSNALKYRGTDPPNIHVGARYRNGECVITVQDNGIGIPPPYYERVFGVFKRLKQIDAAGEGVGLALCKRIVEHYEGRIWIEPNPNQGVTFAFSVPRLDERRGT